MVVEYAPNKIQNLRRVAAKIDFFLSFCFYMQLLFDVLLYEYAGMLNRGWETKSREAGHIYFLRGAIRSLMAFQFRYVQLH